MSLDMTVEYWLERDRLAKEVIEIGRDAPPAKDVESLFARNVNINGLNLSKLPPLKPSDKWKILVNTYILPVQNFHAESNNNATRIQRFVEYDTLKGIFEWFLALPSDSKRVISQGDVIKLLIESVRMNFNRNMQDLPSLFVRFVNVFFELSVKNNALQVFSSFPLLINTLMMAICKICDEKLSSQDILHMGLDLLIKCVNDVKDFVRDDTTGVFILEIPEEKKHIDVATTNMDIILDHVLALNTTESLWRVIKFYTGYLGCSRNVDTRNEMRQILKRKYIILHDRANVIIDRLDIESGGSNEGTLVGNLRNAIQTYRDSEVADAAIGKINQLAKFGDTHESLYETVKSILTDWTGLVTAEATPLVDFVSSHCRSVDAFNRYSATRKGGVMLKVLQSLPSPDIDENISDDMPSGGGPPPPLGPPPPGPPPPPSGPPPPPIGVPMLGGASLPSGSVTPIIRSKIRSDMVTKDKINFVDIEKVNFSTSQLELIDRLVIPIVIEQTTPSKTKAAPVVKAVTNIEDISITAFIDSARINPISILMYKVTTETDFFKAMFFSESGFNFGNMSDFKLGIATYDSLQRSSKVKDVVIRQFIEFCHAFKGLLDPIEKAADLNPHADMNTLKATRKIFEDIDNCTELLDLVQYGNLLLVALKDPTEIQSLYTLHMLLKVTFGSTPFRDLLKQVYVQVIKDKNGGSLPQMCPLKACLVNLQSPKVLVGDYKTLDIQITAYRIAHFKIINALRPQFPSLAEEFEVQLQRHVLYIADCMDLMREIELANLKLCKKLGLQKQDPDIKEEFFRSLDIIYEFKKLIVSDYEQMYDEYDRVVKAERLQKMKDIKKK
jgi:hypothetical protein